MYIYAGHCAHSLEGITECTSTWASKYCPVYCDWYQKMKSDRILYALLEYHA